MAIWNFGRARRMSPNGFVLPEQGDFVQVQSMRGDQASVHGAQVRLVGNRRISMDCDAPLRLPPRTPVLVTFVRDDAMYQFESRLVGPEQANRLTIARPRHVARIQRRQFYRLPMESPTTFRPLTSDGRRDNVGPCAVRLVNISGGGALLTTAKPVPAGLDISLRVPAGEEGYLLDVDAAVLDCHVASRGAARIFLVRVRFFDPPRMDPADRDAIIAHIFWQQRLMLRGRKLLRA